MTKICFGRLLRSTILLLFVGLQLAWAAPAESEPSSDWIQVDTRTLVLTVRSSHNQVLASFHNVSIGSGGTAILHRAGDSTTPLGTFHVAWVNRDSPFHIFFGLDYPNLKQAAMAYWRGVIDGDDYDAIRRAASNGNLPPQDTPLGGAIGIHGVGAGDPAVHKRINWTNGCVALSNADMERLAQWVHIGTRVVIR